MVKRSGSRLKETASDRKKERKNLSKFLTSDYFVNAFGDIVEFQS